MTEYIVGWVEGTITALPYNQADVALDVRQAPDQVDPEEQYWIGPAENEADAIAKAAAAGVTAEDPR